MSTARAAGLRAPCVLRRSARPLVWLYGINALTALILGWLTSWRLSLALGQHAPVDLLGWAFVLRHQHVLAWELAGCLGLALLFYLLLSSALFAALLPRLAGRSFAARQSLVNALRVATLRLLILGGQLITAAAWLLSLSGLYRVALHWPDERWLIATQLLLALPFAAQVLLLALLGHYGQVLLATHALGLWRATGRTLVWLRQRPWTLLAIWLLYWTLLVLGSAAVFALQAAQPLGWVVIVGSQLGIVFKALALFWAWSAAIDVLASHEP